MQINQRKLMTCGLGKKRDAARQLRARFRAAVATTHLERVLLIWHQEQLDHMFQIGTHLKRDATFRNQEQLYHMRQINHLIYNSKYELVRASKHHSIFSAKRQRIPFGLQLSICLSRICTGLHPLISNSQPVSSYPSVSLGFHPPISNNSEPVCSEQLISY